MDNFAYWVMTLTWDKRSRRFFVDECWICNIRLHSLRLRLWDVVSSSFLMKNRLTNTQKHSSSFILANKELGTRLEAKPTVSSK